MPNLIKLPPFTPDGAIQMVVETPRGAGVKLKYEPTLEVFTVSRALMLGVTYPFDWGFVPGTSGDDGDPLDALAVHDCATFPGVMLTCRALGVVDLEQKGDDGPESNPRLILMPTWHDRLGEFEKAAALPERLKQELERFFVTATFFTGKHPRITGWRGPKAADKLIRASLTLQ